MMIGCISVISIEAHKKSIVTSNENSKYYGFFAVFFGKFSSINKSLTTITTALYINQTLSH
jgi:hypothetical protein